MQVKIKSFDVNMDVKNNGIEFQVADTDGKHIGDCILTKTGVIWCNGRTTRAKGKTLSWKKFIELMMENG